MLTVRIHSLREVNETLGRAVGDEMLRQVAARLRPDRATVVVRPIRHRRVHARRPRRPGRSPTSSPSAWSRPSTNRCSATTSPWRSPSASASPSPRSTAPRAEMLLRRASLAASRSAARRHDGHDVGAATGTPTTRSGSRSPPTSATPSPPASSRCTSSRSSTSRTGLDHQRRGAGPVGPSPARAPPPRPVHRRRREHRRDRRPHLPRARGGGRRPAPAGMPGAGTSTSPSTCRPAT